MKIFIIGGAGYIGSHVVKIATKAGHDVITIDNESTGHKDAVLYGKYEHCNILDTFKLDKIFKKHSPNAVIHLGAYSLVGESVVDPYKYYNNNVSGTLSLLKAMIDNKCLKLIFSSSASVFGNPEYIPIDEKHPKKPINPYGRSKLIIETILKDFDNAYKLKYVIFRYFNAAGHDPDGELFERHNPETHILPIIMKAANSRNNSVSIFGNDYETKDGTCIRDFIHVNDLASIHLKGLEYLNQKNSISNEFNLGNEKGLSIKELIDKVQKITGRNLTVLEKERRNGDPSILVASNKKAKKLLSFDPKFVNIEQIIKTLS